jgi:ketosteroid isomerase-like protein
MITHELSYVNRSLNARRAVVIGLLAALHGCTPARAPSGGSEANEAVFAAERAFAATMARRDLAAFGEFLSEEAVFFGGSTPLRGKQRVLAAWSPFFAGETAPFSWEPDAVEVLDSATLALSTGLVRDAGGNVTARFNSIWRLEAPGVWRVVFDKGSPVEPDATRQSRDAPPAAP